MEILSTLDGLLRQLGLGTDLTAFLMLFGLCLARVIGAIVLNPFLGGPIVTTQIKVGVSIILTIFLYPSISPGVTNAQFGTLMFTALLTKEVMIGVTIGLIT